MTAEFKTDLLGAFGRMASSGGPLPSFRRGLRRVYLVTDPESARHVLQTNAGNFEKSRKRAFLGRGIVGSRGASWAKQRELGARAFRSVDPGPWEARLDGFVDELFTEWSEGGEIQTLQGLSLLNLRHVTATLFGVDLGPAARHVSDAIEVLVGREPRLAWLRSGSPYGRALTSLRSVAEVLAQRVKEGQGTFLTRLLEEAQAEAPLCDQLTNYLLAAGETTTMALAWTLQRLARHPEAQARARREAFEKSGGYLRAVVKESLRLHPPVWAIGRRARRSDRIGKVEISRGAEMLVLPYLLHRSMVSWADPEAFRPERFLVDKRLSPFAFLPFGAGPRSCLGAQFALDEIEWVVRRVLQRFHLRSAAQPCRELPLFTLRPSDGAPLRLRRLPSRAFSHKGLAERPGLGEDLVSHSISNRT